MRSRIDGAGRLVATLACAGATLIGAAGVAGAQQVEYQPGFDPEGLSVSADPSSIALQDGAQPLGAGEYAAGLIFHVGGPPLDLCVGDGAGGCAREGHVIGTRLRADLAVIYGMGRYDLRAILPMVLYQSSDFAPAMGQEALGAAGIGDLEVGARLGLLARQGAAVALDLSFTLPTGGGDNFIGDAGWIVDPRVLGEWRRDRLGVAAGFGYRYRQEPARLANLYVDDELTWSLGGEYAIEPGKASAGVALFGRLGLRENPDPMEGVSGALGPEERPAEVLASGRYFVTPNLAIEAGAGTALSSGYGAPPFRVLAGVRWVHRTARAEPLVRDRDGDGIVDSDDRCPDEPEDVDGFQDQDGCPDPDNDGDGILDANDACPMDAEDVDGFQDQDGCPEADNDGDGILDADDACPMEPEDLDGFMDGDGCPDLDNDGDGILDAADACPNDPEDLDGFQDQDGCPDLDNDGDGIPDAMDRCPNEPEVFNGFQDEDGCPDSDGRQVAVVTGEAIEINDKIFFDFNRARIKKQSHKILDAVAGVLKAHANLRVRIEGHTDDQGSADWNRELSQRRAEAVRDYLVGKGVDASRLEAAGFGFDRPLESGKGEKVRAKNRRVEFVIIERTTTP